MEAQAIVSVAKGRTDLNYYRLRQGTDGMWLRDCRRQMANLSNRLRVFVRQSTLFVGLSLCNVLKIASEALNSD